MQERALKRAVFWAVCAVILLVLVTLPLWTRESVERELAELPEQERHALYLRTLETLRTACTDATGPVLSDFCHDQANLLRSFPECDADCQALVERFTRTPSR